MKVCLSYIDTSILVIANITGRGLYITSKFTDNQPWKAEVKILKEDEKDFQRVIKSKEFQYLVCEDNNGNEIPFAINARQTYNDESGGVKLTQYSMEIYNLRNVLLCRLQAQ